ncbi:MAG TPA: HEAT repeat domain-containing protein [Dehalococcoidia bacterium]|nr:HEAT repeat domain-containing protein [Dehalococcoidia bacterium]
MAERLGVHGVEQAGSGHSSPPSAEIADLCRQLADEQSRRPAQMRLRQTTDQDHWFDLLRYTAQLARRTEPETRSLDAATRRAHHAAVAAFLAPPGDACDDARAAALRRGLTDRNASVRSLSAELVGLRAESGALEQLRPLLDDGNDRVRAAAVRALSTLDPADVIPLLLRALERYDVVAAEAVSALAAIGEPAVPPLIAELRGGSAWARWHAARALGSVGDERAIQPLVGALNDGDGGVRWQAARALSRFGSAALDPLLRALCTMTVTPWLAEGADRVLQRVATGALYQHVKPLRRALHHLDAAVEAPVAAAQARAALREQG